MYKNISINNIQQTDTLDATCYEIKSLFYTI